MPPLPSESPLPAAVPALVVRCNVRNCIQLVWLALVGMSMLACAPSGVSKLKYYPPPTAVEWASRHSITLTHPETIPEGMLSVTVYGEVMKPGVYLVQRGARVSDAIATAGGLTDFVEWGLSGVVRSTGKFAAFKMRRKDADMQMLLRNNDSIYVSLIVD